jgi:hypothetical protein
MRWVLIVIAILGIAALLVTVIGFLLPRDHVASSSTFVPAAPSDVYAAITDIRGLPTWRSELSSVEVLATEPLRWREMSRFGPITFEQVKAAPPSHFQSRIADTTLAFGGSWSYDIVGEGAGSRVTVTEHGTVYNPFFRFMSRLVLGHHRTQFSYLRALGRRFGADVAPTRI